ncbi:MAG: hypothetical protein A2231_12270 [Candidatus Firestonebacteria bacterium RIFOXYA2_FULL_40_8]|nr:MAG: hypothetical protein A2231_12270 [Candidatus Firestonebacteria bacterium RIFOXYA2_FULL_40_8]
MIAAKKDRLSRYIKGVGIEIGALHNPLKLKTGQANVSYVDLGDKKILEKQNPEIKEGIIAPAVTASAEDLGVFKDNSRDFVILRHVLEHLPDPVQAVKEIWRVLKPGGIFYLSVPDKRFTFDKERPVTTLEHLLEDHKNKATIKTDTAHYKEWLEKVELKKEKPVVNSLEELVKGEYRIHFHVWEPECIPELLNHLCGRMDIYFLLKDYYYKNGDLDLIYILEKKTTAVPLIQKKLKENYSFLRGLLSRLHIY